MAFADLGSLGTGNSKVSGTTVALATSQAVSVGDLIVVIAAWDNTDTGDFDGLRHFVTDAAGNFYRYVGQWINAIGGAANGAEAMIFVSVAEHALASGSAITVTSVTARTAKAVSARRFSLGTSSFCLAGKAELSTVAADPGALSLSGLNSQEYLFLHALAAEGPNTDAYTWDSDYTQFAGDGTIGSTDITNMHVRGGFRIATLTGDTVDVTSTTADRDYAQVFVAIREYTPSANPDAALVDDFNRANENPLAAPWSPVDTAGLQLISNQIAVQSASGTSRGAERTGYSPDVQAFATVAAFPAANAADEIGVGAHFSNEGASWNGYVVTIEPRTGIPSSVLFTYASGTTLGATLNYPRLAYQYSGLVAGDLVGIKTIGTVVEAWWKTGGAWRMFAAVDDSTSRSGKVGVVIKNSGSATGRVDDFHAARISRQIAMPFIPSATAVHPPALRGNIAMPFIPSATVVHPPALVGDVSMPFIPSATAVHAPALRGNLAMPFIPSVTAVHPPTLVAAATDVDVPFIASKTRVYGVFSLFDPNRTYSGPGNGGETFLIELAPNGVTETATLAADITADATALELTGDGSFPSTVPFMVTIDDEVLYVVQVAAGSYRIRGRAKSNTTAAAHTAGASVSWGDSYDMALAATENIDASFTADINSTGSYTYLAWLICFDSSQAYLGGSRYPLHVAEVLGVFDAGAGSSGSNRCDGAQPSAVAAPVGASDDCPVGLCNPALVTTDIVAGDVALIRYTNPEASVLDLGPRSSALGSWFGLKRVNVTDVDVTLTDPDGYVVDTIPSGAGPGPFTGSVDHEWPEPVPEVTGIAPDASDAAGAAVDTPSAVPWTTVTLPGTDRYFTFGPPHYSEKGWPMCALAVRQGNRRVPRWQSWDWHDYGYVYSGFGPDATFCQHLINRNGIVFDSLPVVELPGPQDIDGPDVVWDDGTYYISAVWFVVLFGGPYIVFGPTIGGGTPASDGGGGGGGGGIGGYAPGVTFPPGGGGPVITPPPTIEGGSGGDVNPSSVSLFQAAAV